MSLKSEEIIRLIKEAIPDAEINVKDLNNGLYFVNLHANGELRSKKLTVAK